MAMLATLLLSCKKDEVSPSSPSAKELLSGNGTVKYWQPVGIQQISSNSGINLYLTNQACAVDNYVVFFDNGDYEERAAGSKCFPEERLIVNTNSWSVNNQKFNLKSNNGSSIYEVTSTLFATEVTITELTSTRFKGYRLRSPGDTIKFVLSAVPM